MMTERDTRTRTAVGFSEGLDMVNLAKCKKNLQHSKSDTNNYLLR
jgi:hypothetical protein